MNIGEISTRMTREIVKNEQWRPRPATVMCADNPCYPPVAIDRSVSTKHAHYAIPMFVPISVAASFTIGGIRVVE